MHRLSWITGSLLLACSAFDTPSTIPPEPGSVGSSVGGTAGETTPQPASGGSSAVGGAGASATGGSAGTTSTGSGGTFAAGGAAVTGTGPFCDVLALMRAKCQGCHAPPPRLKSVPMALASYDDLVAPSPSDAQVRAVDLSITRMQDSMAPMPPAPDGPLPAADIALLQAWIDAGLPSECDTGTVGAAGDGGGVVAPSPYDTPVVCTSTTHWTGGDKESPNMHPGGACIDCHTKEGEGPRFNFAGTVFPSAHEPTDCNGLDGPTASSQVIITDASGAMFTMSVNAVGNFSYTARSGTTIALPYRAKVVSNGLERAMATEQESGDCNTCHTEAGAKDAPGRIMSP